jgi:hypothetical protein
VLVAPGHEAVSLPADLGSVNPQSTRGTGRRCEREAGDGGPPRVARDRQTHEWPDRLTLVHSARRVPPVKLRLLVLTVLGVWFAVGGHRIPTATGAPIEALTGPSVEAHEEAGVADAMIGRSPRRPDQLVVHRTRASVTVPDPLAPSRRGSAQHPRLSLIRPAP